MYDFSVNYYLELLLEIYILIRIKSHSYIMKQRKLKNKYFKSQYNNSNNNDNNEI